MGRRIGPKIFHHVGGRQEKNLHSPFSLLHVSWTWQSLQEESNIAAPHIITGTENSPWEGSELGVPMIVERKITVFDDMYNQHFLYLWRKEMLLRQLLCLFPWWKRHCCTYLKWRWIAFMGGSLIVTHTDRSCISDGYRVSMLELLINSWWLKLPSQSYHTILNSQILPGLRHY